MMRLSYVYPSVPYAKNGFARFLYIIVRVFYSI